ncbi:MAG: hypothetical protein WEK74_03880 [Hydrogenophaga sp.]
MKYAKLALSAFALVGLAACSTPVPVAKVASAEVPTASITQFSDAAVNEAASAYVSLLKTTVDESVAARKYQGELAYRHLSAEACFDSRAVRLLDKAVSPEEKEALVLKHVSADRLNAYRVLAQGHFPRINGLELFTCDRAGLKVAQNTLKY